MNVIDTKKHCENVRLDSFLAHVQVPILGKSALLVVDCRAQNLQTPHVELLLPCNPEALFVEPQRESCGNPEVIVRNEEYL